MRRFFALLVMLTLFSFSAAAENASLSDEFGLVGLIRDEYGVQVLS